ncbi:MAG: hypothetical protein AB8G17_05280 [Gammaproteobacteria bacterium]
MMVRGLFLSTLFAVVAANAQQSEDRVDPSGPYRSKMRVLEPAPTSSPTDSLEVPTRNDGYATALNERADAYRLAADGDTPAAIDALRRSLASEALAPLAQTQMRRDLIALLDAANDAPGVANEYQRWPSTDEAPDAVTSMRAARALVTLAQYAPAEDAIDAALAQSDAPPIEWRQLKVYVQARLKKFGPAATLAATLLDADSVDAQQWQNLIELQRAAGDLRRAAATAEIAFERGVLRSPAHTQTLAKLYLASGLPDHAVVLLNDQLQRGELSPSAENYRLLARAALRSGDRRGAVEPRTALARLTNRAEDWFALAQLHSALDQPAQTIAHLKTALRGNIGTARGRALILLGEAHVALGDTRSARRAFERASELGGVYRQALAYLANLDREPAPPSLADDSPPILDDPAASSSVPTPVQATAIERKRLPRQRFFFLSETVTAVQLPRRLRSMIRQVRTAVRRERLSATGPLQWQIDGQALASGGEFEVRLGVPVRTRVPPRGRLRNQDLLPMSCAFRVYDGQPAGLEGAWRQFLTEIANAGLTIGGDSRTLILDSSGAPDRIRFELQIEITEP